MRRFGYRIESQKKTKNSRRNKNKRQRPVLNINTALVVELYALFPSST